MCPKTSKGKWECPDTWINVFDSRYVEGDAWHWRWFVPHDVPGLIELFGSNDYFIEQLTEFFHRSEFFPDTFLPNPYYWAGNEPDILAVWLFDWAGRPDLTQYYSREVMNNWFSIEASGLPGNDDYGTMSAWYVFGALGFYPLSGSTTYMVGSPVFEKAVITTSIGNLTIIAHNASEKNIYVQNVFVNGNPWNKPFFDHSWLLNANIQFFMGNKPSKWGSLHTLP